MQQLAVLGHDQLHAFAHAARALDAALRADVGPQLKLEHPPRREVEGHRRELKARVVGVQRVDVERAGVPGVVEDPVTLGQGTRELWCVLRQRVDPRRGQHDPFGKVLERVEGPRLHHHRRQGRRLGLLDTVILTPQLEVREERREHLRRRGVDVDGTLREHRNLGDKRVVVVVHGAVEDHPSIVSAVHDDAQLRGDTVVDLDRGSGPHPTALGDAQLVVRSALQGHRQPRRPLPLGACADRAERRRRATQHPQVRVLEAAVHRELLRCADLLDGVDHLRASVHRERTPRHLGQHALVEDVGPDAVVLRGQRAVGFPLAVLVLHRADAALVHLEGARLVELLVGLAEADQLALDHHGLVEPEESWVRHLERRVTGGGGFRQSRHGAQKVREHLRRSTVEIDASREVPGLRVPRHSVGVADAGRPVGEVDLDGQLCFVVVVGRRVHRDVGPLQLVARVPSRAVEGEAELGVVLVEVAGCVGVAGGSEERRRQREEREQHKEHDQEHEAATSSWKRRVHPHLLHRPEHLHGQRISRAVTKRKSDLDGACVGHRV